MKTITYAVRFLTRSKSYTIINLLGLAFSLACCIILMRCIHRELTVDTHCVDRERIVMPIRDNDGSRFIAGLEDVKAFLDKEPIRSKDIIEKCSFIALGKDNVISDEQNFAANVLAADSTFFHFFDYPLLEGEACINTPQDAVLTKACAQRLFGKESAGIPEEILVDYEETCIRIPMLPDIRSLNLSNSVAICLYEALRQQNFASMQLEGELHRLHWKE